MKPNKTILFLYLLLITTVTFAQQHTTGTVADTPGHVITGAVVQINDNLLSRSLSTNILDRLKGVASGVLLNDNNTNLYKQSLIEIRGRSTLFSNAGPLIVVDNFPYDGDLNNINPNDIESISILKDAAASLWGLRGGNGVIILNTKKAVLNVPPKVSVYSSIQIDAKPNLYYNPQLSAAQYIEVEDFLFDKGAYNSLINDGYSALSPAVEIFLAKRNGTISETDSLASINALKSYDTREQILKYGYRESVHQQYHVSMAGGSVVHKYFVSAGYDKNSGNRFNNNYNRLTINANNTYYFLQNKIELHANIVYSGNTAKVAPIVDNRYPYTQIADESGNPLAVDNKLRQSYLTNTGNKGLLSWIYKPLQEQEQGYNTSTNNLADYRVNMSLSYTIIKGLKTKILYSYEKSVGDENTLNELDSYYTRDLINSFTQINDQTGSLSRPIPIGSIINTVQNSFIAHNARFQAEYAHSWKKHSLNMLIGSEIRENTSLSVSGLFYGYDMGTSSSLKPQMDYAIDYPLFYDKSIIKRIPENALQLGNSNRILSYYINGSYLYETKYIASFNIRKEESNLSRWTNNQKIMPLWSAGLAWIINKENFYALHWLPRLKLRTTFGYTGNTNNIVSAYLTARANNYFQAYHTYYAEIINPSNPSLHWEKVRNLNLGLDFETKGRRLSGSIDYWYKQGIDLIGNSPVAAQTGISLYAGNTANTLNNGLDVQLNSTNLNGLLKWYTSFLFNYNRSKVSSYAGSNGTNYAVVSANYNNPIQGYPFYAIFSFKYAGLDEAGNPIGSLNNTASTNYAVITNSINRENLVYHGSASPVTFGSLLNTFSFNKLELSFNVIYKLGYYFRRSSLKNGLLYTAGSNYQMADYEKRWKKPGDELMTNVPSLIYPASNARDQLYEYSEALVEKADHIRLQDIRLAYNLDKVSWLPFNSLNVFAYSNNLGIIWRANKQNLDPDYPTGIPSSRTMAFGLKGSF